MWIPEHLLSQWFVAKCPNIILMINHFNHNFSYLFCESGSMMGVWAPSSVSIISSAAMIFTFHCGNNKRETVKLICYEIEDNRSRRTTLSSFSSCVLCILSALALSTFCTVPAARTLLPAAAPQTRKESHWATLDTWMSSSLFFISNWRCRY